MDQISKEEAAISARLISVTVPQTNNELAKAVGCHRRTVNAHMLRFEKEGLVEKMEVYPGYRYRWTGNRSEYADRLGQARRVFGL